MTKSFYQAGITYMYTLVCNFWWIFFNGFDPMGFITIKPRFVRNIFGTFSNHLLQANLRLFLRDDGRDEAS